MGSSGWTESPVLHCQNAVGLENTFDSHHFYCTHEGGSTVIDRNQVEFPGRIASGRRSGREDLVGAIGVAGRDLHLPDAFGDAAGVVVEEDSRHARSGQSFLEARESSSAFRSMERKTVTWSGCSAMIRG